MLNKKLLFSLTVIALSVFQIQAQFNVASNLTAQQYVQNVLIGPGVSVSNITFTGSNTQIGKFINGNPSLGINSGVVMSSGDVTQIDNGGSGTNLSTSVGGAGDADLLAVAQSVIPTASSTNDAAILKFKFIPSGDTVKFNFVFASDEYTTYSCTQWNDVFGFFVNGPNPAGGNYVNQNLAVVPNTNTPITISTIYPNNAGSCSGSQNAQYYVQNTAAGIQGFNGYLIPIEIKFAVVCGQEYNFKFAVADVSDRILDTGIFLEAGSFSSDAVDIAVATVDGDTTVVEGCTNADIIFTRPESQIDDTLSVVFSLQGTATAGVDYVPIASPVVFLPGVDTIILNIAPIQDNIDEGIETIIVTAFTVNSCGDTIVTQGIIYVLDKPNIQINENDPTVVCADDSVQMTAIASGGFSPYTYAWSNGQVGTNVYGAVSVNGPTNYIVTATDNCGFQKSDTVTITMNQTLAIDTMYQFPASACLPTGAVSGVASGMTGVPDYHWGGPGANNTNGIDASVFQDLSSGWYYFTVTDNVCEVMDSIFLEMNNPPQAVLVPSVSNGCAPLSVNFENQSQNTNQFTWDFGNGQTAYTTDLSTQNAVFNTTSTVQLIASDGTCSDTAYVTINVAVCGCTDPTAFNYDPTATFNDGSCQYPQPEAEAANVYTPNGDGSNELFELFNVKNATLIELTIFNRWGNVMYSGSGLNPNPSWDGKDATEGTYFYKYTVYGFNDSKLEGHGFFQLVRK